MDFGYEKELDNTQCEYDILKQRIAHWMPCDEPVNPHRIDRLFSIEFHSFRRSIVYL